MPMPPRCSACRPVGAGGPARAYCYRQLPLQRPVRVLRAAALWAQETQARTMQTPKRILLRAPQEHYPERLRAALLVGSALQPQLQPYAFRLQPCVARL